MLASGEDAGTTATDRPVGSNSDYDSDEFEYASSVSSLNDSSSTEFSSEDDDTDDDDDEDLGRQNDRLQPIEDRNNLERGFCKHWGFFFFQDEKEETVDLVQQFMQLKPPAVHSHKRYVARIYGYYRKSEDYGGYGIVMYQDLGTPIGAYYGVSRGGTHLYYILKRIKKCLQIAADRGFPRLKWSVNSRSVVDNFNNLFLRPSMLECFFHYKRDVADINFCKKCLRDQMCLTDGSFEPLVPVIRAILKLQYEIQFKYRIPGSELRSDDAACYVAKCGAEALEKKMNAECSDEVVVLEEAELKMEKVEEELRRLGLYIW